MKGLKPLLLPLPGNHLIMLIEHTGVNPDNEYEVSMSS